MLLAQSEDCPILVGYFGKRKYRQQTALENFGKLGF
jgi:hypothetical protein